MEDKHTPLCHFCNDIREWEGDAPLPYPLTIWTQGVVEHHCGFEGAKPPRFSFRCPECMPKTGDTKCHQRT